MDDAPTQATDPSGGPSAPLPLEPGHEAGSVTETGLSAGDRLIDLIGAGGPVLLILLVLSLIGVTIVLVKAAQLVRLRLWDRRPIRTALTFWAGGRPDQAINTLHGCPHPVAGPLAYAMAETVRGDAPEPVVREEVERRGEAALEELRGQQRPLEIIAGISPLLGLLGTVLGMIEAFRQLELAGAAADPAILSGGIWEALLTTAAGLAIAVPAVIAVQVLDRLVDRVRHEMSDAVTRVFTRGPHQADPAAVTTRAPGAHEVDRAA